MVIKSTISVILFDRFFFFLYRTPFMAKIGDFIQNASLEPVV